MRNEIYLFNPENDMALANFTPYYKAPSEIIRMANDLSVLPAQPDRRYGFQSRAAEMG